MTSRLVTLACSIAGYAQPMRTPRNRFYKWCCAALVGYRLTYCTCIELAGSGHWEECGCTTCKIADAYNRSRCLGMIGWSMVCAIGRVVGRVLVVGCREETCGKCWRMEDDQVSISQGEFEMGL
jgi:hypothetical protein